MLNNKRQLCLDNILCLFNNKSTFPLYTNFFGKIINTNILLIFFLFILFISLFGIGLYPTIIFLTFSLLLIIILYYSQRKQMSIKYNTPTDKFISKENFKYSLNQPICNSPDYLNPPSRVKTCTKQEISGNGLSIGQNGNIIIERPSVYRFCNDCETVEPNDISYIYPSQKLAGCPNPKTNIPPIVVPPIASLDYWKTNNLVTFSAINSESQQDAYQSGYQVTTCCGNNNDEYLVPKKIQKTNICKQEDLPKKNDSKKKEKFNDNGYNNGYVYGNLDEEGIFRKNEKKIIKNTDQFNNQYIEDFENNIIQYIEEDENIENIDSKCINLACGYNKKQLYESGLPSNYSAGNCEKDPAMKEYNENLFTQTIQPGIYYKSQINEPINSNIGISFTQPFLPTTCSSNKEGNVMYIEHDPNTLTEVIEPDIEDNETPTYYNVYDPRFNGYGTSYRAYTNKLLGQTQFMYDDINAVRMPNYIVRSNIDHLPFADQYGEIPCGDEFGNKYNSRIRELANDAFTRSALEFRTSMSESLMRKRNSEMWQTRQAPISTSGQRMGRGY
jgi:hypothetical protein